MVTFPDSPPNGTEIIDRQDDGSVIIWTYDESKNEWTYQQYGSQDPIRIFTDQVLVRDNHEELPAGAAADPSELKTQKDVNYFLNESGGGGGGSDPDAFPWIQIDSWGMRENNRTAWGAGYVYEPRWSCNNKGTHTWQYEIDVDASGAWVDIAQHPNKEELGFVADSEIPVSVVLLIKDQKTAFPGALMRFRITTELNGVTAELCTDEMPAWQPYTYSYDPPLRADGEGEYASVESVESLEDRVELIEKALFPYVEFGDRYCYYNKGGSYTNSSVRIYQYWSSSANGSWIWAWMVKMPGTDTWIDVDDMTDEQQAEIGYLGDEDGVYLFLYPPNEDDMPDIEVKQKVTDELEGFETAEEWSESFFPRQNWVNQDTDSSVRNARSKRGRGRLVQHIKE